MTIGVPVDRLDARRPAGGGGRRGHHWSIRRCGRLLGGDATAAGRPGRAAAPRRAPGASGRGSSPGRRARRRCSRRTAEAFARRTARDDGPALRIGVDARELSAMRPVSAGISASCCVAGPRRPDADRTAIRALRPDRAVARPSRAHVDVRVCSPAAAAPGGSRPRLRRAVAPRTARRLLRAGVHRAARPARAAGASRFTTCRSSRIPNGSGRANGMRRRWLTRRAARSRRGRLHRLGRSRATRSCATSRVDPGRDRGRFRRASARRIARRLRQRARAAGALRRLDLQPPPAAAADRGVRARHGDLPDARLVIVGAEPHLAAARISQRSRRAHGVGERVSSSATM